MSCSLPAYLCHRSARPRAICTRVTRSTRCRWCSSRPRVEGLRGARCVARGRSHPGRTRQGGLAGATKVEQHHIRLCQCCKHALLFFRTAMLTHCPWLVAADHGHRAIFQQWHLLLGCQNFRDQLLSRGLRVPLNSVCICTSRGLRPDSVAIE